jgi:response regulator NasT
LGSRWQPGCWSYHADHSTLGSRPQAPKKGEYKPSGGVGPSGLICATVVGLEDDATVASTTKNLRVLIADGVADRSAEVARTVVSLGHEVIGEGVRLETVAHVTAAELPDVALVIVGENSRQAFDLLRTIVHEAACPVIAILDVQDRAFVDEAARLGIFSYIAHAGNGEELQSSIDIALQRFAEYHALEGAFGRRAVTERAKGILMERHFLDEQQAFHMLRDHARRTNRKIVDVAESVLESHRLLSSGRKPMAQEEAAFARRPDEEEY